MLGCTHYDGNGNQDKVISVINTIITNFNLDIYDYNQVSHRIHKRIEFAELKKKNKKVSFNKENKDDKEININN